MLNVTGWLSWRPAILALRARWGSSTMEYWQKVCWATVTCIALAATSSHASSYSECQIQATRGIAIALLTEDLAEMTRALEMQAKCRHLAATEDKKQIEFQNQINKLIKDAVAKGSFDSL